MRRWRWRGGGGEFDQKLRKRWRRWRRWRRRRGKGF
jgi:hypothetical protein